MGFFQPPQRTKYDLNFTVLGIPVQVHPLFWVIGLLLGAQSDNLITLPLWIAVIFVSILIHELGHSLMMRQYGQDSYIALYFGGGLAIPTSSRQGSRWGGSSREAIEQIYISLAGPFAGFLLAAFVLVAVIAFGGVVRISWLLWVIPFPIAGFFDGGLINVVISMLLWVNIFWGLINLMPVFPLDGGQVSRAIFVQSDPWNGLRKSLWLSVIAGAAVALVGLICLSSIFMAVLFGMLAFQSYQLLQGQTGLF